MNRPAISFIAEYDSDNCRLIILTKYYPKLTFASKIAPNLFSLSEVPAVMKGMLTNEQLAVWSTFSRKKTNIGKIPIYWGVK